MTRRDLAFILPALSALGAVLAEAQNDDSEKPLTMHSRVFVFDRLPVNSSGGKTTIRTVLQGKLPTGESVEIHETALMPGQMPHAPHKHRHTEFLFIREGNLEFIFGDRIEPLGPGGVAYAASNEMHGLKNVGTNTANYFVIEIGLQEG